MLDQFLIPAHTHRSNKYQLEIKRSTAPSFDLGTSELIVRRSAS